VRYKYLTTANRLQIRDISVLAKIPDERQVIETRFSVSAENFIYLSQRADCRWCPHFLLYSGHVGRYTCSKATGVECDYSFPPTAEVSAWSSSSTYPFFFMVFSFWYVVILLLSFLM